MLRKFRSLGRVARAWIIALLVVAVLSTAVLAAWEATKRAEGWAKVRGTFTVSDISSEDAVIGDGDIEASVKVKNISDRPMQITDAKLSSTYDITCNDGWSIEDGGDAEVGPGESVTVVTTWATKSWAGEVQLFMDITASGD